MDETRLAQSVVQKRGSRNNKAMLPLTEGNVMQHLLRLSVPMVWGMLAIIVIQLVDMFFISLLGAEALAAVSFTFPVTYTMFSIFIGFGIAMSSVVSRLIGANAYDDMHRMVFHCFVLVIGFGALFSIIGYVFCEDLFRVMGAEGAMLAGSTSYMRIWFAGTVFICLPLVGNSAIRACGNSKTPAWIMVFAAVANLVFDPIFIFGLAGMPAMGIEGAALASILSYILTLFLGLYVQIYRMNILVHPASFGWFTGFGDSARRILSIALPAGFTNALQPLLSTFITAILAGYGAYAVAAFGIVTRVEALLFVPIVSLATGMAPLIGQNFGAQSRQRVSDALRFALSLKIIWSGFVAVLLFFFGGWIVSWFTDHPQTAQTAILYFMIVPASYILGNIMTGWSSAFNAVGLPMHSFSLIFIRMIVLSIPACFIGAHFGGVFGVFIALAAVNLCAGIGAHLWGRHMLRQYQG